MSLHRISDFREVAIICNSRAEAGPLQSVKAAMPGHIALGVDVKDIEPWQAMSYALNTFDFDFKHHKPKVVVVLGDRYETLAAALAAMFLNIPVAHIHGGERTIGAFDDAMRDSITSIAQFHFAAAPNFQARILQIRGSGSRPYRVYTAGAPGLDGIPKGTATREQKRILVTYHPETNEEDRGLSGAIAMLGALSELPDHDVHFTGVNTDPGAKEINRAIEEWCWRTKRGVVAPMTHAEYVKAMQTSALVMGNSSAGIIEAPWIGIPTVNLGDRQNGRPCARSVFSCRTLTRANICAAMAEALTWKGPNYFHHYQGGAAPKIARIIGEFCGIEMESSYEQVQFD